MALETDSPYARAIAYATAEGRTAGQNAAGWYLQDAIGGRAWDRPIISAATGRTVDTTVRSAARTILRGIEDGDPAVLDGLPSADLSGEWADTLTGPQLVRDAVADAYHATGDYPHDDAPPEWFGDICDAYETAFSDAAQDAIATACKAVLA